MTLARIQRWAMILSGYDYALSYHSGDQDSNVGCMSRLNFNLDREIEFFTMDKRVAVIEHAVTSKKWHILQSVILCYQKFVII